MPKLIVVIEIIANRGAGTNENPVRNVNQYFTTDGELLAESDPVLQIKVRVRYDGLVQVEPEVQP